MRRETFKYLIKDQNSMVQATSLITREVSNQEVSFYGQIFSETREKSVIAKFLGKELHNVWFFQKDINGGKSWSQKSRLKKENHQWVLRRSKLGECWECPLDVEINDVFAGEFLCAFFFEDFKKNNGFTVFDLRTQWFSRVQVKDSFSITRDEWPFEQLSDQNEVVKFEFSPLSSFMELPYKHALVETGKEAPNRIVFPKSQIIRIEDQEQSRISEYVKPFELPDPSLLPMKPDERLKEEEKFFSADDGVQLFGRMTKPEEESIFLPIILVHGSGPETGNSGTGYEGRDLERTPFQFFKDFSQILVSRGFQVFRYDKRGVGLSGGEWKETTRKRLVHDLMSAVSFVSSSTRKKGCILLGFSEGANLALSTARLSSQVRAVICAGGPAEPLDKVMLEKIRFRGESRGRKGTEIESEIQSWIHVFPRLREIAQDRQGQTLNSLFRGYSIEWWVEHFDHEPAKDAALVQVPILLLHGRDDAEVLVRQSEKLYSVLKENGKSVDLKIFEGLNHFFGPACKSYPGFEYDIPYSIDLKVVDEVEYWIKKSSKLKEMGKIL